MVVRTQITSVSIASDDSISGIEFEQGGYRSILEGLERIQCRL